MKHTHKYNGSVSDMRTFASVSKPLKTHGTTNSSGCLRVLLDWFNLAELCHLMSMAGMNSVYEYADQRNLESEDLEIRLKRKTYVTPYTPSEIRDRLINGVNFYMEGKTEDCGFDVLVFGIRYYAETNTLELKIDRSMLEME